MKRFYPVYDWSLFHYSQRDEFFNPTGISLLDYNRIPSVPSACSAIALAKAEVSAVDRFWTGVSKQ